MKIIVAGAWLTGPVAARELMDVWHRAQPMLKLGGKSTVEI